MDWIDADTDRPKNFEEVEALTDKGKNVTAWVDLFESDDDDYFDWEWMERNPLDYIVKWRYLPPANIQQQVQADSDKKPID